MLQHLVILPRSFRIFHLFDKLLDDRHHKDEEYIPINDRYQIIKSVEGLYYPHIKYTSTSRAFHSLESALVGMIVYDKTTNDDLHLNKYIFKLLDMEW